MYKLKDSKYVVFSIILLINFGIFIFSGCGGGGGRQVLPGENPFPFPQPTPPSPQPPPTPTPQPTPASPSALIAEGWRLMENKDYLGAISKFQSVVNHASATQSEIAEGYNGLGWAKAKAYGIVEGLADFNQAGSLTESILGKACALVQTGEYENIKQAVTLFESIGLGNINYNLQLTHQAIGVTSAEAHAMLAYAYYWRGYTNDYDKARAQILVAKQQDSSSNSVVAQIYLTLRKLGLTGLD